MASYNGAAAVQYAKDWYNGYNTAKYPTHWDTAGNGDCTNFVSQCLVAGGIQMRTEGTENNDWTNQPWYYLLNPTRVTGTWKGAQSLRLHIKYCTATPRIDHGGDFLSSRTGLQPGDIVFALSGTGGKGSREAFHCALVEKVDSTGIMVYQHTNSYHGYWGYSDADTIFCHIVGCITSGGGGTGGLPSDVNQSSKKTGYIATQTDPLTIRSGPGTGYGSVGSVPRNATVDYYTTSLSSSWYYVVYGSIKGYGSAQYILPSGGSSGVVGKTGTVRVNSAGLNIRTSPNGPLASYKLYDGHRITVLEVASAGGYTWYRLRDQQNRTANWGRSDFIVLD